MDKVAMYKDLIRKTAGVLGGAILGTIGGATIGSGIGHLTANVLHHPDKEMRQLHRTDKKTKEELHQTRQTYDAVTEFDPGAFDTYLESLPGKKNLTVGDVEGLAHDWYQNQVKYRLKQQIYKQASFHSVMSTVKRYATPTTIAAAATAIPMGIWVGKSDYQIKKKYNTDKDKVSRGIQDRQGQTDKMKSVLSGNTRGLNFKATLGNTDYNNEYSPGQLMMDINGRRVDDGAYYGQNVNKELEANGIDYRKIKWSQYKNMVQEHYEDQRLGEDQLPSIVKRNLKYSD